MVTDGALANIVLGRTLSLDKALEPNLSDDLLSIGGHRTMFSAGEASPEVSLCSQLMHPMPALQRRTRGGYGPPFAMPTTESPTYQSFVTGTRSAYWRLLRKGTADAFSPRAVRYAKNSMPKPAEPDMALTHHHGLQILCVILSAHAIQYDDESADMQGSLSRYPAHPEPHCREHAQRRCII